MSPVGVEEGAEMKVREARTRASEAREAERRVSSVAFMDGRKGEMESVQEGACGRGGDERKRRENGYIDSTGGMCRVESSQCMTSARSVQTKGERTT
jgi:hypothetical protein